MATEDLLAKLAESLVVSRLTRERDEALDERDALTADHIRHVAEALGADWSDVDPAIRWDVAVRSVEATVHEARRKLGVLWRATGIADDKPVEFVADAIRGMLDTSRVARTQLRPQLARAQADAEQARRERDEARAEVERMRAGIEKSAAWCERRSADLLQLRDASDDRHRRARFEHVASAESEHAQSLRALLGPATTEETNHG